MSEAVVVGWERALMAAEKVKERLRRATKALDGAGVPYAVVGGNAVAEWVARIDDEAVRNTRDVDILVRRADFAAAQAGPGGGGLRLPSSAGRGRIHRRPPGQARAAACIFCSPAKRCGRKMSIRALNSTNPNGRPSSRWWRFLLWFA